MYSQPAYISNLVINFYYYYYFIGKYNETDTNHSTLKMRMKIILLPIRSIMSINLFFTFPVYLVGKYLFKNSRKKNLFDFISRLCLLNISQYIINSIRSNAINF